MIHLKHRQIYTYLHDRIAAGDVGEDGRLPTELELSRHFNVSRSTVIRALRDLEQEGLVVRRRGSGTFVRTDKAASNLRSYGVLISGIFSREHAHQTIFAQILDFMTSAAQARGASLMFGGTLSEPDPAALAQQADQAVELLLAQNPAGVFFVPLLVEPDHAGINDRIARRFAQRKIPLVLLDRDLNSSLARSPYDLVGLDNRHAGYMATEHLLGQGCRRIEFIQSPRAATSIRDRVRGYRDALRDHGIEPRDEWVRIVPDFDNDAATRIAENCTADGLLCYNDDVAAFMMRALLKADRAVPGDVCLMGFDNSVIAPHLPVPLGTVAQPAQAIGETIIETMEYRIANPDAPVRTVLLHPHLAVRASCQR